MRCKRIIGLCFLFCLVLTIVVLPVHAENSYAVATPVEEVCSSNSTAGDYFIASTPMALDNTLSISGHTSITTSMFRIALTSCTSPATGALNIFVVPDSNGDFSITVNTAAGTTAVPTATKGTVVSFGDSKPGYNHAVPTMSAGYYRLLVARAVTAEEADTSAWWLGPLSGDNGYVWKDAVLKVETSNNPKLVKFQNVLSQRNGIRSKYEPGEDTVGGYVGSYERYLDPYMTEYDYVLENPDTGEVVSMTDAQVQYIAAVADEIVEGESTNYGKLRKIYAYVAEHFYYDYYAWKQGTKQYAHPYDNLYALRTNATKANSSVGKVATVCQGFSAMVVALARSEGIPARIVNGIHLDSSTQSWSSVTNFEKSTHWWTEAYVDGKWITIDASAGSLSGWERTSWEDEGTWIKGNSITYGGFDPSDEAMSGTYLLRAMDGGNRNGKYICYANEVTKLQSFLSQTDGTTTNGYKLNNNYKANDRSTWGNGEENNFTSDGFGRTYQIRWSVEGLTGNLDLGGFSGLRYLSAYSNKLTSVDLTDCTALESLHLSDNDITTFDSTDCTNLAIINLKENVLEQADFYADGKVYSITAVGGTFSFYYDASSATPLTITVNNAPQGMVFDGIYDSSDNKVASSGTAFMPSDTTYTVKFSEAGIDAPTVSGYNTTNGKPAVKWNPISGAVKYQIYRKVGESGTYAYYYSVTDTSYINSSVSFGTRYYYKVAAVDENGVVGKMSNEVGITCKCATPVASAKTDASSGKIVLNWGAIEGASRYYIYRYDSTSETYKYYTSTTATTYTNNSVEPGVCYYYKVQAICEKSSSGNSAQSASVYVTCDCARPVVTAKTDASTGKVVLSWNAIKGASKYYIYRYDSASGTYKYYTSTTSTTYTNYSVEPGVCYYYKVQAICGKSSAGNSVQSTRVYVTCDCAKPVVKASVVAASGNIKLSWNAVASASKYYIYRATSYNGTYEYWSSTTGTSYTTGSGTPGTTYYFKVKAICGKSSSGNSALSSYVYATKDCARPTVSISRSSAGKPKLSWGKVTGASKYYIYRWDSASQSYKYYTSTTGTTYTNTSAKKGYTYYYKVKAICGKSTNGNSALSTSVSIKATG